MTEPGPAPQADRRPQPRWGQYSDVPPQYPPPVIETVAPALPPAVNRTPDVVITVALLLIGFYDVIAGFAQYAALAPVLREVFTMQGLDAFTSDSAAVTAGLVANVARIAILCVAVVFSALLISRGRRAFWVPLAAGVLAAIVVAVCIMVVVVADPAFGQFVQEQSA